MNILELEKFKIEDAINFHDELNPLLFDENNKLKPNIKKQLLIITDDFVEYMGIPDLAIEDVIITGSNVAFTYTPHSDIDLHILVDFSELSESDVYKELFNAKKMLYNDTYKITIRDIPVEVYVQDTAQAHTSLGEYSIYQDKFTRFPTRKRANLDEISAEHKFERLEQLAIEGLKSQDIEKVKHVLSIIKRYRQAGLDTKGEFGPENLAFKAIRSKGYFQSLFNLRNDLKAKGLSIEEELLRRTFEESIGVYNSEVNLAEDYPNVDALAEKHQVKTREINKQIDLGIKLEMRNNSDQIKGTTPALRRDQAMKVAISNISKDLEYYEKFIAFIKAVANINQGATNDGKGSDLTDVSRMGNDTYKPVKEASGYIPSEAQKNDPRFSYALTKDVRPDTMKKGAKAMGLGDISRAGVPPLIRPGKKKNTNSKTEFGKGIY
jgi:hypothetical protein